MKLKLNRYYKLCYITGYIVLYIDNKWCYRIAEKFGTKPLVTYNIKYRRATVNEWQEYINTYNIKIEEMSKEDLFLELL